jgi:hypothetical protein
VTDPTPENRRKALKGMLDSGLVELDEGGDGEAHYDLSDFGRRGVAVIMDAVRMERRHRPDRIVPVGVGDGLTFFLMPLPLVRLPQSVNGTCTLTMELDRVPGAPRSASVWTRLREGRVVDHSEQPPRRPPSSFAGGSVDEWLDALLDGEPDRLRLGGRRELAAALIEAIHDQLPTPKSGRASGEQAASALDGDPRPTQFGEALPPVTRPGMAVLDILQELGPNGLAILNHIDDRERASVEEIVGALDLEPDEVERTLRRMSELGALGVSPPGESTNLPPRSP